MAHYRVLINGQNFLVNYEGKPEKLGFYKTAFVTADSIEKAEEAAVNKLRDDDFLQNNAMNAQDDPPMLFAEGIEEFYGNKNEPEDDLGFSWYRQK